MAAAFSPIIMIGVLIIGMLGTVIYMMSTRSPVHTNHAALPVRPNETRIIERIETPGPTVYVASQNPYATGPPERDDVARLAIPMTIATQGPPSSYQQVGIMRKEDSEEMLPLFGRKAQMNRDRWNYYTSAGYAGALPVRSQNKDCTETVGCPELYDSDSIVVEGKDGVYSVMMYTASMPMRM